MGRGLTDLRLFSFDGKGLRIIITELFSLEKKNLQNHLVRPGRPRHLQMHQRGREQPGLCHHAAKHPLQTGHAIFVVSCYPPFNSIPAHPPQEAAERGAHLPGLQARGPSPVKSGRCLDVLSRELNGTNMEKCTEQRSSRPSKTQLRKIYMVTKQCPALWASLSCWGEIWSPCHSPPLSQKSPGNPGKHMKYIKDDSID